ncbi:MAG: hypothetical protein R3F30_01445 [Planctomycetota bacterium]
MEERQGTRRPGTGITFGAIIPSALGSMVLVVGLMCLAILYVSDAPLSTRRESMVMAIIVGGAAAWLGACHVWHARIRNQG